MIGGNVRGIVQVKREGDFNAIGERVPVWENSDVLIGFLDYMSVDSGYVSQKTKVEESTHIFLCSYQPIDRNTEDKRMEVNGQLYDVLLIDDPMELHQHLEIYLRYRGGQS